MADLNLSATDISLGAIVENVIRSVRPIIYCDPEAGNDANDGRSWATAVKKLSVAETKRVAFGNTTTTVDEIRVAKTTAPVSLGSGTFTDGSAAITIPSALTAVVDNCDTAWTAAANVTQAQETTNRKQGTAAQSLSIAAAFVTGKVGYRAITGGSTNYSAYTRLSFSIRASAAVATGVFKVCLCSDLTGDVIVDEFIINDPLASAKYQQNGILKNGGGSLGTAIQSVALYAISDPGTVIIVIDDIQAANNLHMASLIGKNVGNEPWMGILSIAGTTINLGLTQHLVGSVLAKYWGTAETTTLYSVSGFRDSVQTTPAVSTAAGVSMRGGFNTATDTQDGITYYDGLNESGTLIQEIIGAYDLLVFERFAGFNYSKVLDLSTTSVKGNHIIRNIWCHSSVVIPISFGGNGWFFSTLQDVTSFGARMLLGSASGSSCLFKNLYIYNATLISQGAHGSFYKNVNVFNPPAAISMQTSSAGDEWEDCNFRKISADYLFATNNYSGIVFRRCSWKDATVFGAISPGGADFINVRFYDCTFSGNAVDIQCGTITGQWIDVLFHNTVCNNPPFNSAFYTTFSPRKNTFRQHRKSGSLTLHQTDYREGVIKSNLTDFRTAAPCVEIQKTWKTPPDDTYKIETTFKAPMNSGVARTLNIWLKRSQGFTGNCYLVARVDGIDIVGPTIVSPILTETYAQYTITLPSGSAVYNGVVELVVQIDGLGGSTPGSSSIFADDFSFT